jgi:fructosamine-3-kinase
MVRGGYGLGVEITVGNVSAYLARLGLIDPGEEWAAEELGGGISATVIALRGPSDRHGYVVKQALPKLKVPDDWPSDPRRSAIEAKALSLCDALTPGIPPRLLHHDEGTSTVVLELAPADRRNWQAEIAEGRAHAELGRFAGETLGTWHRETAARPDLVDWDGSWALEQQRLDPYYRTLLRRRPELEAPVGPLLAELERNRRCFVHGDLAPKNILVGPSGRTILDFEAGHLGDPVLDLAFFGAFPVLSALRWPVIGGDLRILLDGFLAGHAAQAGDLAGDAERITRHTAGMILCRTDGKSVAAFLDPPTLEAARRVGLEMLRRPERGIWPALEAA